MYKVIETQHEMKFFGHSHMYFVYTVAETNEKDENIFETKEEANNVAIINNNEQIKMIIATQNLAKEQFELYKEMYEECKKAIYNFPNIC